MTSNTKTQYVIDQFGIMHRVPKGMTQYEFAKTLQAD